MEVYAGRRRTRFAGAVPSPPEATCGFADVLPQELIEVNIYEIKYILTT